MNEACPTIALMCWKVIYMYVHVCIQICADDTTYLIIYNDLLLSRMSANRSFSLLCTKRITEDERRHKPAIVFPQNWNQKYNLYKLWNATGIETWDLWLITKILLYPCVLQVVFTIHYCQHKFYVLHSSQWRWFEWSHSDFTQHNGANILKYAWTCIG